MWIQIRPQYRQYGLFGQTGLREMHQTAYGSLRYLHFNLTNASETFTSEALWIILAKLSYPRHSPTSFAFSMMAWRDLSCPVAMPLYRSRSQTDCNRAASWLLSYSTCFSPIPYRYLRCRLESSLVDLLRQNANIKTLERPIFDALFPDDCALMAHSEPDHRCRFAEEITHFNLYIRLGTTEVLYQPAPGNWKRSITSGTWKASYLCHIEKEIAGRISTASQSLGRLRSRVMNHRNINLSMRIKVYKSSRVSSIAVRRGRCTENMS